MREEQNKINIVHDSLTKGKKINTLNKNNNKRYSKVKDEDLQILINECSKKLILDPACLKTRALRGHACMRANMWDIAVKDFSQIIEVRQDDIHGIFSRGMALFKSNNMNGAINDFSRVLEIVPNHINARYARAGCYNIKGKFPEAIQDYTKALELDRNHKNKNLLFPKLYLHEIAEKLINEKMTSNIIKNSIKDDHINIRSKKNKNKFNRMETNNNNNNNINLNKTNKVIIDLRNDIQLNEKTNIDKIKSSIFSSSSITMDSKLDINNSQIKDKNPVKRVTIML